MIMVTDHHTTVSARRGFSGWLSGVLVITGYEHSDRHDENHLLIFGLDLPMDPHLEANEYVREAHRLGALTFIAHPTERRPHHPRLKAYPWTAPTGLPFDGVEVWNYLSGWAEHLSPWNIPFRYLLPDRAAGDPDAEAVKLWDRLAISRSVVGIAGLDAHATSYRWGPFRATLFSYSHGFQRLATCVETASALTGSDQEQDARLILRHLGRGHAYFGNRRLGELKGFRSTLDDDRAPVWGECHELRGTATLRLSASRSSAVSLIQNGKRAATVTGRDVEFKIHRPGMYRVELRRGGRMWIMSNHFRVTDSM